MLTMHPEMVAELIAEHGEDKTLEYLQFANKIEQQWDSLMAHFYEVVLPPLPIDKRKSMEDVEIVLIRCRDGDLYVAKKVEKIGEVKNM